MNKALAILHQNNDYYEPTIELEVVDLDNEKTRKRSFREYYVCKTSKDFADALVELSDDIEQYVSGVELTVNYLKILSNTSFYTLIDNYEYLQNLKNNAYGLTTAKNDYIHKYRQHMYGDEGGYGAFRQELIVFNDLLFITDTHTSFKKRITEKLYSKFHELVPKSDAELLIALASKKLENIQFSMSVCERTIRDNKQRLELLEKDMQSTIDEIKKLTK